MVQATLTRVCSPPTLPEYLQNVHDLKPIIGVPTDDEVKAVHAVIRAAQSVSLVPEMYDPNLSMSLSQHLFEAQMGIVIGILVDIVHTPPSLPSHAPISLKPISGVPSDKELQSVHAAVRAYYQMSITRYMDQTPRGELESRSTPRTSARTHHPVDLGPDLSDKEAPVTPKPGGVGVSNKNPHPIAAAQPTSDESSPTIQEKSAEWILENLRGTVQIVKALVSCQRIHARFIRRYHCEQSYKRAENCEVMNEKGQLPTSIGLPPVDRDGNFCWTSNSALSNSQLAQYLQFYGIGGDLVEEGDELTIKAGQGIAAEELLAQYLDY